MPRLHQLCGNSAAPCLDCVLVTSLCQRVISRTDLCIVSRDLVHIHHLSLPDSAEASRQDASSTSHQARECAQGQSLPSSMKPHHRETNSREQRAQELIAVGQSQAALNVLHEHVTSKRSRNSPIASLEPVLLLFVDLCVELRKGKSAKDGLYQYKNIAQNTNVGTIEVRLQPFK